jgi:glyoxylase-like metal-dependent hydrolase (beta-lactamase superfamily II)
MLRRMKQLQAHLHLANRMIISNVWLLHDGERRFLVDTGHPLERPALKRSLWRAGVRGKGDLTAVMLTHRHSDHAGNAAWVRETFGCPVLCHAADAPFLDGSVIPPRLARGKATWAYEELLCHVEDTFPARTVVDESFEGGAFKWGFRVFHAPGHTEGSVLMHHEPTATLFSGDVLLTGVPPLRTFEWLRLAVPSFSNDVTRCHAAVLDALREMPQTRAVAGGHGPAVLKDAHHKLLALLR